MPSVFYIYSVFSMSQVLLLLLQDDADSQASTTSQPAMTEVCPLHFIYNQCFPCHKFCDMENEYFAGGNCETRGMLSACYIYNQCFPCRNVCDMENDEFQCFPRRNVCDIENDEFV